MSVLQQVIKETASSFWRELGKEAVRRTVGAAISEVVRAQVDLWKHRKLEHQKRELSRQFQAEDEARERAEAEARAQAEAEAKAQAEDEERRREEQRRREDPLPGDPGNAPPLVDDPPTDGDDPVDEQPVDVEGLRV